jgi:hypothetical protein
LVLYDYDGNSIQAKPMKNRSDTEAIRSYTRIYDEITVKGLKPTFKTMDNEVSKALKQFLHTKDTQYQLLAPHVHRQNVAEQVIQTFKNHVFVILCATDKQFPLHLWDRLIPQAILTLNLLRQSRINPKFSAHAQLRGPFGYNATPLAPPGKKVIIHEKTDQRGSWSPHGLNRCYVGPAMEHYRVHRVYCSTMVYERISDTVEFSAQHCKVPGISSADAAAIAEVDLTHALMQPTPTTPLKQPGTERMQAIKNLASIFEEMAPPRVAAMEQRTSISPRMASPQPLQAQATRVTSTTGYQISLMLTAPHPTSQHATTSDARGKGIPTHCRGLTQNRICALHHRCGNRATTGIPALTPTAGSETNSGASIHKRTRMISTRDTKCEGNKHNCVHFCIRSTT